MTFAMLPYYFLKQVLEKVPNNIKENLEFDNDLLFNLSTFNDLASFYKLFQPLSKDKYKLNDLLQSDKFNDFILECIQSCKKVNSYKQLLFIYAMISHHILMKHVLPYLSVHLTRRLSFVKACNMIDYYYARSKDNIDLTKISLRDYFPNGFEYHDFMEELIHRPFIKIFKFFCTRPYYTRCMKRKSFYYTYCNRSKTKLKLIPYKIYDWILNHRGHPKASHYLLSSKVDTTLFNLTKKPYLLGDETFTYSFDEIIEEALKETNEFVDAINSFIVEDNDKYLKKILNIDKAEKL